MKKNVLCSDTVVLPLKASGAMCVRMKKNRTRLNGSYTIEAAFIIPIIMLVIVSVFYLCFYLHDSLNLKAAAYSYGMRHYKDKNVPSEEILNDLDRKLILAKSIAFDCNKDDGGIGIAYTFTSGIPVMGIKIMISGTDGKNTGKVTISNLEKADFLRKSKAVSELVNQKEE